MDYTIIDIETAPMRDLPEPPEAWLDRGMGNRTKPEAVEAKRADNRQAWVERAALDWRTCQVIAVGSITGNKKLSPSITYQDPYTEAEILEAFWIYLTTVGFDTVVGFNIRSFDLPILIGRSAVNGVRPSRKFLRARFRTDLGIVDWCEILSDWGGFDMTGWSLAEYAKHFELKHQAVGDGAEIPTAFANGNYEYIVRHLEADLLMCRDLHEMFAPAFL